MNLSTPPAPLDIEKFFSELNGKKRSTIRLHPRAARDLPGQVSKIGGAVLHDGGAWPPCLEHSCALVPVIQLVSGEIPNLPMPDGKTVLQVLWCPFEHRPTSKRDIPSLTLVVVRWLDGGAPQARLVVPKAASEGGLVARECALHPESVAEYPSVFELPYDLSSDLERCRELVDVLEEGEREGADGSHAYQNCLGAAPGTKLGGHPRWIQGPQYPRCCGRAMEHLLTIGSVEWSNPRWRPHEEADDSHRRDAGLRLGDDGYVYLFFCRNHPVWNTQAVYQTS
jgi:hypothetical protein